MGGKLWQRVPDESGQDKLQEVDLSQFKIERPTIVYLSGFLTNNDQPAYVSGSIKQLGKLLRSGPEDAIQPDIYSWSHKGLSNLFNLAAYDTFPGRRSSEAGYILSANIIMPLVADGFSHQPDGSVEGRPLPADEAKRRLRNLTFFGYSAGSIVAQETFNASLNMMKKIGYDEEDVRKLLKEVVLVAAGCISRPTKETDRFTTLTLIASNDRINRFKNWVWGTIGTLRNVIFTRYARDKHEKELSIRPLSDSYMFVSTAVRPSLHEYEYDEDGNRTKKPLAPLYPKWTLRRSYHELPHYVTTDLKNNGFANIILCALTNAVNRTETQDKVKLLDMPAGDFIDPETREAYETRIQEALKPMPASLPRNG